MATSSAIENFDESMKKQITSLLRVMNLVKYCKQDSTPCKIDEGLFLGSLGASNNKDALKDLNVTHILTVAGTLAPAHPEDFVYKIIQVADRDDVNIKQYFDECFTFIDDSKRCGEGVLVHCYAGKSRSVTIVVAYLMKTRGMSLSEALQHVKGKRAVAAPNPGFIRQLQDFEKSLQGASSLY
ncbi:putative phosphoric monoester hydrolase [Lupinus albus]|uniref:Putative phosphoric monoester hydrolase n=1 Tax=Lupinus albus TaxID=3870 RepID=A0A6A4PKW2_LUPAL|nr:putative phosphoric monoester hydrolase [Lupinus albus]